MLRLQMAAVVTREPVMTKVDMYRRWAAGEFGNAWPSYDDLELAISAHPGAEFMIRYMVPGSRWCRGNLRAMEARAVAQEFEQQGAGRKLMRFSPMAPDEAIVLQGEILSAPGGWWLYYSTVKKAMRVALAEKPQHAQGIVARAMLKEVMDPASYEDLCELLDSYDHHVIEFSTYSRELGTCLGRNTIFWEVRRY